MFLLSVILAFQMAGPAGVLPTPVAVQVPLSPPTGASGEPGAHQPAMQALVAGILDPALGQGFDFPVGDRDGQGGGVCLSTHRRFAKWVIAPVADVRMMAAAFSTLAGESWNSSAGGSTAAGQPVWAIGDGTVTALYATDQGSAVEIEHRFLENGRVKVAVSITSGLAEIQVAVGERVRRRQKVGSIAKGSEGGPTEVRLAMRRDGDPVASPAAFIREHRRLFVPAAAAALVIAVKREYRLYYCEKGQVVKSFPMAVGQQPEGPKTCDGDNRTPEGEYSITQKALGPFEGEYGRYLGAAWMRLSYPNTADARAALAGGRITAAQCAAITAAQASGLMPPGDTALGGGIGIHGWAADWPDGPQNLTWGCLSLRHADLLELYPLLKKGTPVIIHR